MQKIIYTEKEIDAVAQNVLSILPKNSVLCLRGKMGAGKTMLIKAIVKHLGGKDRANSPTFGIVNEYHYPNGDLLGYHFDFYRLNDPSEALDLGLEDYLSQDTWIFIEWPEKVLDLLPENYITLQLRILDPVTRELNLTSNI